MYVRWLIDDLAVTKIPYDSTKYYAYACISDKI